MKNPRCVFGIELVDKEKTLGKYFWETFNDVTFPIEYLKSNMRIRVSYFHTYPSQVPQPLLLKVGWVYNTPKTVKFFFDTFHSIHLVMHWEKVIKIG